MPPKPKTTDAYLAGLNADQRATLEKLRRTIRKIAQKRRSASVTGCPHFASMAGRWWRLARRQSTAHSTP